MVCIPILLAAAPLVVLKADAAPDAACPPQRIMKVGDTAERLRHPLGAEPPAQLLYAVVRELDGCNRPIVLIPQVGQSPIR